MTLTNKLAKKKLKTIDAAIYKKHKFADESVKRLLADIEKSTGNKVLIAHINPEKEAMI